MKITVIEVPYDSGHYARRMGRGPFHLAQAGLEKLLESSGHAVRRLEVRLDEGFRLEIGSALETQRLVSQCVGAEIAEGRLPLVLSGNCATAVGSVAGAGVGRTAVVWLDAHGDFNTPETTPSGFFDGMALAMLVGDCFTAMARTVPEFEPVPAEQVITIGMRDLDAAEAERFERSAIASVGVEAIRREGVEAALGRALDALPPAIDGAYLHLDLDVLDPSVARINPFQAPGGLELEEVEAVVRTVAARLPLRVAALTAYDPEVDEDGRGGEAALRLATVLAEEAAGRA
ncbi:MAG: arginase family protein [Thermoanaerobaculia bacterium]|nr:arginase family protein [Thermoanaerobaculia bacterium]